jgi:electron transfer flavoprotein alpha subunit
MDFAVLVKVVPPLEGLTFDPERKTVVRRETALFLNPFDQRALRVALDLRRAGESVSVLSLGPHEAREPLRDARALGADRTLLLSDPGFAGSDTLATARALAAGVGGIGHDVILGGAWTTDSETGQVGPELAALLGIPVLTGARSLSRDPQDVGLTVTVDTPTGWSRYRVRPPVLITVGEKIAKPGKVTPEDRARVSASAVEVLTLGDLSLPPGLVGRAGSPTVVRSVHDDAPHRTPFVVSDGTPAERVTRAVDALRPHLAAPAPPRREWLPLPPPAERDREVLVLVTNASGALDPDALAVLSEVRRSLPGHWPSAVWAGGNPSASETARVARAGARAGYRVPLSPLPSDSRTVAEAFSRALDRRSGAAAGVFLSHPFGREVAGQLAARRSLGLTGDAIGVRYVDGDGLVWSKPSFGGRTIAGIVSRTRPSLATVRPGIWEEGTPGTAIDRFEWELLAPLSTPGSLAPLESGVEVVEGMPALDQRDVVVAVGMGTGGPEGIATLSALLARWDAALGATRRVVDAGWVPRQFQIGLTGASPAPRLGVLLGVSGSTNHLVGWTRARVLLAVNRDPGAPVFRNVDVGIVGTLEEIVPLLADAVAPLLGR